MPTSKSCCSSCVWSSASCSWQFPWWWFTLHTMALLLSLDTVSTNTRSAILAARIPFVLSLLSIQMTRQFPSHATRVTFRSRLWRPTLVRPFSMRASSLPQAAWPQFARDRWLKMTSAQISSTENSWKHILQRTVWDKITAKLKIWVGMCRVTRQVSTLTSATPANRKYSFKSPAWSMKTT